MPKIKEVNIYATSRKFPDGSIAEMVYMPKTKHLSCITQGKYKLEPNYLLGEETNAVLAAGADSIHFDVMDNHYVPNLTIGPMVCKALRDYGMTAPIDVHLMVTPVDRLIADFALL